jgi:hypothetical protein
MEEKAKSADLGDPKLMVKYGIALEKSLMNRSIFQKN